MNPFGISDNSYQLLTQTLSKYPQIEEVIIFGSRANGSYKQGSDIDLALKGSNCTPGFILDLKGYINRELPIPYHVDIVHYDTIRNVELKENIDRAGLKFM
jgi:predicted nucleotidyltransferase